MTSLYAEIYRSIGLQTKVNMRESWSSCSSTIGGMLVAVAFLDGGKTPESIIFGTLYAYAYIIMLSEDEYQVLLVPVRDIFL